MRRPWVLLATGVFLLLVGLGGYKLFRDHRNERRLRHLSELLDLDLLEYEKQTWSRAPAFGEPVEGDFLELLREADFLEGLVRDALDAGPLEILVADGEAAWLNPLPEPLTPGILAWIERREAVLLKVLEAARTDTVRPGTHIRDLFREAAPYRRHPISLACNARDLLRVDAVRMAEAERPRVAVDRILAIDHLAVNLHLGADMLRWFVGSSIRETAARSALALVARGLLGSEERRRLESWAAKRLAARMDLSVLVRSELLTIQVVLRAIAEGKLDWLDRKPFPIDLPSGWMEVLPSDPTHWLDVWEGLRGWAPRIRDASRRGLDDLVAEWDLMAEDVREPLLGSSRDIYLRLREREEENILLFQALLLGIRLRDWHDEHGAWPDSLADLDPPALEGRKWIYGLDPETRMPFIDLDPKLDEHEEEPVPLFRVR